MSTLSKDEWLKRYAARIVDRAGLDQESAMACALAGYEAELEGGDFGETPEDMADEEMSYFTDDGDE